MELVLSLFPGIDLLGRGFESEGFCVVRGPDTLWDSMIEEFSAPPTVMPLAWASALLCLPYGLRRLRGEAYVADDFSRAD